MKLVGHKVYSVSTVDTDGLVLQHQGISSHSTEYAPMCFQWFMGKRIKVRWINADLLSVAPSGINFEEFWIQTHWLKLQRFYSHPQCAISTSCIKNVKGHWIWIRNWNKYGCSHMARDGEGYWTPNIEMVCHGFNKISLGSQSVQPNLANMTFPFQYMILGRVVQCRIW